MCEMETNKLEQMIVDKQNEDSAFELLSNHVPNHKIEKKSAKGCKKGIPLR